MRPITSPVRTLVAAPYIITGLEALRDPRPRAEQVAPTVKPIADRLAWLPKDPVTLVRIQGAVSLGTGALLLSGRARRFATLLAAVQLTPALATEHRYWTEDDPERRASERSHLLKNAALFGALLMVSGAPRRARTAELRRQLHDAQAQAGIKTKELRKQAQAEIKEQRREAMADVMTKRREALAEVKAARRESAAKARARRRRTAAGIMAATAGMKAAQKKIKAERKRAVVSQKKAASGKKAGNGSHGLVHAVLAGRKGGH
ncbi:DoxX family membrane protein [Actinomadura harenae]|uniref:DoxX family membrane protein n=1 Tax=Actinomadura harenae TaxID=2483351 RepID=A0A3M2LKL9_9ACTN|nr:DoxX family membrane protein [Actinomadura harenae]RMI37971.1 DoxX family membrane protein [Actinomadura harenae]